METMGFRLQKYRSRTGYTAKQVAERINVAESTYRAWESGRAIRGEPYPKLAEALGISISELLTGEADARTELNALIGELENALEGLRRYRSKF